MKRTQFSRNLVINLLTLNMLYFLVDTMCSSRIVIKATPIKVLLFQKLDIALQ